MDAGAQRRLRINALVLAALGLVAAVEVAPLAAGSGVPAFVQDWLWPSDRFQVVPFLQSGLSPWSSSGIGHPSIYPTSWWPFVLAGALCYVFGVHFGAVACLFAALLAAGLTAAALARVLGCGPAGRFFAGLAFAANPAVLNEVHAGHWIYLLSYSLTPAVAVLALDAPNRRDWLFLGALVGLGGAQLQFLPMDLLVVAAFIAVSARQHKIRDFALTTMVALCVTAPQWAPGLLAAGHGYLDALRPLPHWEMAQSSALREAPRLLGYIGGYDRALLGSTLRALWWWLPVFALAGALAQRRSASAWVLVALMLLGIAFVAGMHGPLAPLLGWLFAHVPATALFRELYHAAALAAFSMAALAAIALETLWRNDRAAGAVASAFALVVCVALALRVASGIPAFVLDDEAKKTVVRIGSSPGSARYLALPAVYPVAASNAALGGASPFLLPIGSHPTLDTSVAEYPTTYALALLREGRRLPARATLRTLGASSIMRIPSWQSSFERVIEPNLRGLINPAADNDLRTGPRLETLEAGDRIVVQPFAVSPQSLPGAYVREARDLRAVVGGETIDLIDPAVSPNPRDAWARTALWPVLPAWALAQPPGVFTLRAAARLIAAPSLVVAAAADGPPRSDDCSLRTRLAGNFGVLACGPNPTLEGRPPLVVSSATRGGILQQMKAPTGEPGEARLESSSPWEVRARVTASPGSAIVLRERFDPAWEASTPGLEHVEVDGYANAWVTPRRLDAEPVVIRYKGAAAFFAFLWLSQLTVAVAVLAALVSRNPRPAPGRSPTPRVCVLTFGPLNPKTGGLTVRILALIGALRRHGIEVWALLVGPRGPNAFDATHSIELATTSFVLNKLIAPVKALGLMRECDCVIVTSAQFALAALLVRLAGGIVVWDTIACESIYHEQDFRRTLRPSALVKAAIWRVLEVVCGACAQIVVSISADEQRIWEQRYPFVRRKLRVLEHSTLDAAAVGSEPSRVPYLLFVGNLKAKHNLEAARFLMNDDTLIAALRRHGCQLVLAGDGSDDLRPEEPLVRAVGFVDALGPLIGGAECCLAPMSQTNGTSTKIIDYMKYGRRIIATAPAMSGIAREPGFPCTIVPFEGFATAVERALSQPPPAADAVKAMHEAAFQVYGERSGDAKAASLIDEVLALRHPPLSP